MSVRGLVVALLCGLVGLGGGALVSYAVQPHPTTSAASALPVPAYSPSVPIDVPTESPYAKDIRYPALSPNLRLPVVHTISNHLASWTYHVPEGWQAYAVCAPTDHCKPPMTADTPLRPGQVDHQPEVRFRPPDEPLIGGYSLRVRVLDNTMAFNPGMMKSTKIQGFRQAFTDFSIIKQGPDSVYFEYRDEHRNLHRFNYFQWFAVEGDATATLEMSVAGREADVPGLEALFLRFADDVLGTTAHGH
ncbi:MAG: hypothetical protein WB797_08670 [Nocardioides sp.]